MRDFLVGLSIIFLVTVFSYTLNKVLNPYNHFSFLEWVGILGTLVIIKTGIDIYNEEQK
tara:strand:+ start:54 stop:230 length:177 start_codon:yes stop_codon:yes gene_type:complete